MNLFFFLICDCRKQEHTLNLKSTRENWQMTAQLNLR